MKQKSHRTRLGTLLIEYGANQTAVDVCSNTYYDRHRFGEYCLEQGACTRQQLELALSRQAIERGDYSAADRLIGNIWDSIHIGTSATIAALKAEVCTLYKGY